MEGVRSSPADPVGTRLEVYRRILRRNGKPCAWDPARGSLGHYVHRIAGNAIADMLATQRHHARAELHGDPERFDEHADPRDPVAALEAADAALEAGVDLAASHEAGELLSRSPLALWERALAQRIREQTAPGQLTLDGRVEEPAPPAAAPASPRAPRERRPRASEPDERQGSLW
jgi:hypothetical protein